LHLNAGEWSEIYVASSLIWSGKLDVWNDGQYDIAGIRSADGNYYSLRIDGSDAILEQGLYRERISRSELKNLSEIIKRGILYGRNGKGSFSIPGADSILEKTNLNLIRGNSGRRSDIGVVIRNMFTGDLDYLTFSVKSLMGSPPTLFNVSKSSGIIFKLTGSLERTEVDKINNLQTVRDRIRKIADLGIKLKYSGYVNDTFRRNLTYVDLEFPEIYAYSVLAYFSAPGNRTMFDIVKMLEGKNNGTFAAVSGRSDFSSHHLQFKYEELLLHVASGMTSASEWSGSYDVSGGFIIVGHKGEISCFTYSNPQNLRKFLFENTKFDAPSTIRHNYGYIHGAPNRQELTLIAQIRFVR
jgi:hypothetical protein